MKTKLQRDFLRSFFMLFAVLITIWGSFYILALNLLINSNEQLIMSTSDELLEDLSDNIELMEQINYATSQKDELRLFLEESELATRHYMALEISDILITELLPIDSHFSIVLFDKNGWFYRFAGSITTTECERLYVLTEQGYTGAHFTATLDGNNHIGYSSEIVDINDDFLGRLFVLESEQNFLEYFYDSTDDYAVSAAILSGDEIISSNAPYIGETSQLFTKRQVGITPFQVATWLSPNYDSSLNRFFITGVVLSTLLMVFALLLFVRKQRKTFFAPLEHVMREADKVGIDGTESLQPVDNMDFDNLISKINDLLTRISKQNEIVNASLLEAEYSKTETQQAINSLLKKQINAHFIVNSLSSIQMLQKEGDTTKSNYALAALSDMVRYAFEEDDEISVWDELTHIQKYVDIMNVRYSDKITFELEADDNLMEILIPRMIIQPIVENSIVHGFANREENCLLTLSATACDSGVKVTICDNGHGMGENILSEMNSVFLDKQNEGLSGLDNMAIYNVKRRLFNYSPLSHFFVQSGAGEGTTTTIIINKNNSK